MPETGGDRDRYHAAVRERLCAQGYDCTDEVVFGERRYRWVARKVQLEIWRWNRVHTLYSETVYTFADFARLDLQQARDYAVEAMRFTRATKKAPVPGDVWVTFFCLPVAVVDGLDLATADALRTQPPPLQWVSAIMPVAVEPAGGAFAYLEKTPPWRWDYYPVLRKQVEETLRP